MKQSQEKRIQDACIQKEIRPIAFVIGGSRGIGLETAKFLNESYTVVLFARDSIRLREVASNWAHWYAMDVCNEAEVAQAIEKAIGEIGRPSLLCYFAGRALPARFTDLSIEAFEQTLAINLLGFVRVAKHTVPSLYDSGRILVCSSMAGYMPVYGYADYAASKYGLVGCAGVLAQELASRGISVSILCPPDTDTEGYARENEHKPAETHAISAGAKLLQAAYVAQLAVKGLKKRKFRIVPGFSGKMIFFFAQHCPSLFHRVCLSIIKKSQRGEK